jgi:hypothetical protein
MRVAVVVIDVVVFVVLRPSIAGPWISERSFLPNMMTEEYKKKGGVTPEDPFTFSVRFCACFFSPSLSVLVSAFLYICLSSLSLFFIVSLSLSHLSLSFIVSLSPFFLCASLTYLRFYLPTPIASVNGCDCPINAYINQSVQRCNLVLILSIKSCQ